VTDYYEVHIFFVLNYTYVTLLKFASEDKELHIINMLVLSNRLVYLNCSGLIFLPVITVVQKKTRISQVT